MQVAHHLLLSHGLALQALRARAAAPLGIVLNLSPVAPATTATPTAPRPAGRRPLVRWYMDPLFNGEYPPMCWQHLGADAPRVRARRHGGHPTPMDFLGINYYTRAVVSADGAWDVRDSGKPLTDMGWEVYPEGLTELLLRLHRDWPLPPLYVKENGAAFVGHLVAGRVHDRERTDYIARHIAAVGDALAPGVPMAGYMVWSLLDNFEWASGYAKRFGIVHVDYATQRAPQGQRLVVPRLPAAQRAQRAGRLRRQPDRPHQQHRHAPRRHRGSPGLEAGLADEFDGHRSTAASGTSTSATASTTTRTTPGCRAGATRSCSTTRTTPRTWWCATAACSSAR
jgi:beta-glucosidase/6-phospho-beta-glucosidase/beta-galactosidase